MLWGTQISKPNTKDYDAGFGVSLATIPSSSSDKTTAAEERVIVHGTKRGMHML